MRYESNCGLEVLQNLFARKELMRRGDPRASAIRPLLFVGGGVLRGVDGAARACALEDHNLEHVFTHVCGTSTGAASSQFLLTGQTREHINIYWKEAASKEFISFGRFIKGEPIEDTRYLSGVFKNKLNLPLLLHAPPEFHVAVTHATTGEGRFIDAKKSKDFFHEAVRASMSIPFLCGEPVSLDGELYYDGVGAFSMPTKELVATFRPTDLLIFANAHREESVRPLRHGLETLCFSGLSPRVSQAFLTRARRFNGGIAHLRQRNDIRWTVVWSEDIDLFERREEVLVSAASRARRSFFELLSNARVLFNGGHTPRAL